MRLVKDDPDIMKLSHRRLYKAICRHGRYEQCQIQIYASIRCLTERTLRYMSILILIFFGMERIISKLMRFLKSASMKGEESRQVLLLMGPVGAGKSALTEHIKQSIEGEIYYHLKDDPQRGEPLQLLPRSLRPRFNEKLGISIEGDVSPVIRYRLLERA